MRTPSLGWTSRRPLAYAMLITVATGIPAMGRAQIARVEIHPFQSMTLTDQEFLAGRKDGKPVTLAGELRLPRPGNDRLPAVVLLHGSGGSEATSPTGRRNSTRSVSPPSPSTVSRREASSTPLTINPNLAVLR